MVGFAEVAFHFCAGWWEVAAPAFAGAAGRPRRGDALGTPVLGAAIVLAALWGAVSKSILLTLNGAPLHGAPLYIAHH